MYILEVHLVEPEDEELNTTLFLWPKKILHAFELSDEVTTLALPITVYHRFVFFKDDLILDRYTIF